MAAMEKITFKPLILEFQSNNALYNLMYKQSEIKYGTIPSDFLSKWIVEVLQPLFQATIDSELPAEKIHTIAKVFYLESLKLIGSGLATRYKDDYTEAFLLLQRLPTLVRKFPLKVFGLMNDVLQNLHLYAANKTSEWCRLMTMISDEIKTIEDFKIAGRIFAWRCGLAHLRYRLVEDFKKLPEDLQRKIKSSLNAEHVESIADSWLNKTFKFRNVQGGFIGNEGVFVSPPVLFKIDENIFVSDLQVSHAFFTDEFGSVFLPAEIANLSSRLADTNQFNLSKNQLMENFQELDVHNITSIVSTKDTLIFTRENSYFLYVFSLANV